MKIVVLVKFVPDSTGARAFTADTTTDRVGVDGLLSELDEYAVEQSLRVHEAAGEGEITFVTVGPEQAGAALRKALSMGGDAAVHVVDDAIHGSDALATSLILSKVLEKLEYDLVITGMASTDAGMAVVPVMVAERLGLPAVTLASELTVNGGTVRIRRDTDDASETIEASLPALVSVTDQTGEARYPSFKGIMAAKKKPVTTYSLADLGVSADEVGLVGAWSRVDEVTKRPPRSAGIKVVDEGDGGVKLAEFLVSQKFI
ncbi:MAG TPA: electron transfer flavoprotein subunit beta/FixA family protein [Candidatus Nanopelagicales bacterium]|jgi:electron transfer flavoprotein beta subunit